MYLSEDEMEIKMGLLPVYEAIPTLHKSCVGCAFADDADHCTTPLTTGMCVPYQRKDNKHIVWVGVKQ